MTRRSTWLSQDGKFAVLVESSTRGPHVASGMFGKTRAQCEHSAKVLQHQAHAQGKRRTRYTVVRIPDDVVDLYRTFDLDIDQLNEVIGRAYERRNAVRSNWERSLLSSLPDDPF